MKRLIVALALCSPGLVFAGTMYKCETDAGTIYQATQCPQNAKVTEFKKSSSDEPKTLCDKFAKSAEAIMSARQGGADMSKMTNDILSTQTIPEVKNLATAMINSAYDKPRYSSDEYQQRAIMDFKNDNYLSCVKAGINNLK